MIIFTVVVTHNRLKLLEQALYSIAIQSRKPDYVIVVSNSADKYHDTEQELCIKHKFKWIKNSRTNNYSGALNTGVQSFIEQNKITECVYFSSLDDDDIWQPNYLKTVEGEVENNDIILANIVRDDTEKKNKLNLPSKLDFHSFLSTNPGVGGSNTFVRLKLLLKAGAFDELMSATVDRDIFVRLFLLNPKYKVINNHLVTLNVEPNRNRVTTNRLLKLESYQYFFYKYRYLMRSFDKEQFLSRAKSLFNIDKSEIIKNYSQQIEIKHQPVTFNANIDFQFIIGFIAGNKTIADRIINTIISKKIKISKLIIIDNLPDSENFTDSKERLQYNNISFIIVSKAKWKDNLPQGYYGEYFKKYSQINSIPIGRTILQHHLYMESLFIKKPVFWIIDDDVSFSNTIINNQHEETIDVFQIINQHIDKCDALIGSVSKDPPLPFLSSIRSQLVDLYYSSLSPKKEKSDYADLYAQQDYYYDITDASSKHTEAPIFYHSSIENDIKFIFSGKAVSRPCLQNKIIGKEKLVSNRGPNTLVFNREILKYYPVVNMEVNEKFVRRGDLLWVLLNQLISNRKIVEHTFCVDQNRPLAEFEIERELDKSANDIIGYAFNKAIVKTISLIKKQEKPNRPKDIYDALNRDSYLNYFTSIYEHFLSKRKSRFLMNYYRIIGLMSLLIPKYKQLNNYLTQFTDDTLNKYFLKTISLSKEGNAIQQFLKNLSSAIWTYEASIKNKVETSNVHLARIMNVFDLESKPYLLGSGSEGVVFTDSIFVYKHFFSIKKNEWLFLKEISRFFYKSALLENLNFIEHENEFYIKYPYHEYKKVDKVPISQLVNFLKFCKACRFVFSNIKPINFILTKQDQLKLIDYGRSFEPYTDEKFINMVKRAFLMLNFPQMDEKKFKTITSEINMGKEPQEILGWEDFLKHLA